MTQAKHTPGPWVVVQDATWWPWQDAVEVNASDGSVICFTGGSEAEEQKINARLIAAAPDLLEAAKDALSIAEDYIHDQLDGTSSLQAALDDLASVREAIAKAEGRS